MKTNMKILASVLVALAGAGFAYQSSQQDGRQAGDKGFEVVSKESANALEVIRFPFGGEAFAFEVADDLPSIQKGLSGRTEIPAGTGMLFIDDRARIQSYWMVDCLTDMDIAFVAPSGKVTAVHAMKKESPRAENEPIPVYHARLPRYSSNLPAKYAIETPPGTNKRLGIKPGTVIDIDWSAIDSLRE